MKKAISFLLMAVLATPVFAESLEDLKPLELPDVKNVPKSSKLAGWQFGIGAPIMPWPLSSINWFVGYANKNAAGFWGKRFGFRADLATSANKRITANVYDENNINFDLRLFGLRYNYKWRDAFDTIRIHGTELNLDSVHGKFTIDDNRFGGLVDFYPFGNTWFFWGLRASGGYYFGKMNIALHANVPYDLPPEGIRVNIPGDGEIRARLSGGTKASAKLNWKYNGPYGGVGFDIGVYRGFKFFFDAGVIFTNAPKLYDRDIFIPENRIQGCYAIGNGASCGWANLDINDIPGSTAGLISGVLDEILTAPGGNFNGIDVSLFQNVMIAGNIDTTVILNDITSWVVGGGPPPIWYNAGLTVCGANCDVINNLVQNAINQVQDVLNSDVQKIIDEYRRGRRDTVRNVNNTLQDFQFYPMVRLGVMYRF